MFSTAEFVDYRKSVRSFDGILGYAPLWEVTLDGETPRNLMGDLVTCNYFTELRLQMARGAGFTEANCSDETSQPVVVLSHQLWRNRFGSDENIVGKRVILNRQSFSVVGVAPQDYAGIEVIAPEFFAPISTQKLLRPDASYFSDPNIVWLMMIGRRKGEATNDEIGAELRVVAARRDADNSGRTTSILLTRVTAFSSPRERTAILGVSTLILGAFGLVLLTACANVANLLLARGAGRSKEIALRLSLGASRRRLIQQLMTESLLISITGGFLGSVLALSAFQAGTGKLLSSLPAQVPKMNIDTTPDMRVFLFGFVLSTATGLLFGLIPALQASKGDLASGLKQDSAGTGKRTPRRLQGALVGVQVGLSMLLLVTAGLLLHGLYAAQTIDPGFAYRNLTSVSYDLLGAGYTPEQAESFQAAMMDSIRAIPGVVGVAQMQTSPLSLENGAGMFGLPGQPKRQVQTNAVSQEYLPLLELPLVAGRNFEPGDVRGTRRIIVTETTARSFWPDQQALGQQLEVNNPNANLRFDVIGIVKDSAVVQVGTPADILYFHAGPEDQLSLQLLVKTRGALPTLSAAIASKASALDPALVVRITPVQENLDIWRTIASLVAGLSGSLGALAMALAAIGVYGVVSYTVSRRVRELGIRIALGAKSTNVSRLVLSQSLRPALAGALIGLAAAGAASGILQSVLFGVSPLDPTAFVGAAGFLVVVSMTAAWIPARRATRVNPIEALRQD
jgi:predicted permease